MRRALKLIAAALLMLTICRATSAIHDARVSAQLERAREAFESQRAEAIAAISETEDADLKRLGLID